MPRRRRDEPKEGRRGKGEGSITQRADGTWKGYVTTGYGPKGAIRKYYYGKAFAEVRDKVAKAQHDLRNGLPLPSERQRVSDWLAVWLAEYVRPRVSPRTYECYAEIVRLHLLPDLGGIKLAALRPQDVQKLLNQKLLVGGLSPRRVALIRAVLRVALGQALKLGDVSRNAAALATAPRQERHEIVPLSPAEARQLLDHAKGDRLEAIMTIALALGLREGEILGLRWTDVDLEKRTLSVAATLHRVKGGGFDLRTPKTEKSRRTLNLPQLATAALQSRRLRQLEERLLAGSRWQDTLGLVFTTNVGTPLDASGVVHRFHHLLQSAGLPRIRFHDLRHSAASFLLAQGVPMRTIMEQLGHSQISLTANLYTHLAPAMREDVADRMDAILGHRG